MKSTLVTLRVLQELMTFCPSHAYDAAKLAILFETEPLTAQLKTKDLVKRVIATGDIGTMPPERIKDLAIWVNVKPTEYIDQNRSGLQIRITPAVKVMLQELADAYTEGNKSKLIMNALRHMAGIEIEF